MDWRADKTAGEVGFTRGLAHHPEMGHHEQCPLCPLSSKSPIQASVMFSIPIQMVFT